MIPFDNVAAHSSASGQKWDIQSAGLKRQGQREIGHIEDLELLTGRAGVLLLGSAPEVVSRSHHHVAHPGRHNISYASGADELVKKDVGNGANQTQIALLLPNDLVPGRKRDHLLHLETKGNAGAVRDELSNGFTHCKNF